MIQSHYSLRDIKSIELYIDAANHARKRWRDDMFSEIDLVASNAGNIQYAKKRERKQITRVWKYFCDSIMGKRAAVSSFTVYLNES